MNETSDGQATLAPPPHRVRLGYLDGWRGIAVLAVLAGHFLPIPQINMARMGVEFFFVLSGRLMAGILFVDASEIVPFLKRRLSRVWPALWVFVITCWVIFSHWGRDELHVSPLDVIASLTFTTNYVNAAIGVSGVFQHLWSLAVEEWGYLLLAVIAIGHRKIGLNPTVLMLGLAVLCIADGAWRTHLGGRIHDVYWLNEVRFASLLLPAAFYLIMKDRPAPSWMPIAAGGLGVLLSFRFFPDPLRYSVGTAAFALSIVTIESAPAWVLRLLSTKLLMLVGYISFSLYLWQQPLYELIGPLQAHIGFAAKPLLLASAFAVGTVSYRFIEKPARRWINAHWSH